MVKAINIFLEGSGDSRERRIVCRRAFQKLCERMGFKGKMPTFIPSGTRNQAYKDFTNALKRNPDALNVLLVDSEDPVKALSPDPYSNMAWIHLNLQDGWNRPTDTEPYQALIMATSMETWIATDRAALKAFFGKDFQESALPSLPKIEAHDRKEIFNKLEHATRNCTKRYQKGDISFKIFETLDPQVLAQHLTQFQRLKATLDLIIHG